MSIRNAQDTHARILCAYYLYTRSVSSLSTLYIDSTESIVDIYKLLRLYTYINRIPAAFARITHRRFAIPQR